MSDGPELERLREGLAARDVACPRCGYNLRGLTGGVCPECSRPIGLRDVEAPALRRSPLAARIAVFAECAVLSFIVFTVGQGARRDALAGLALVPAIALALGFALCWALRPILEGFLPRRAVGPVVAVLLWAVVAATAAYAGVLVVLADR